MRCTMRAVGYYNVTREICPRGEDDMSFDNPCKDAGEARSELNGAAKASGEAAEAQCEV